MVDAARKKPELFVFGGDVTPITRSTLEPSALAARGNPQLPGVEPASAALAPRDDTRIARALQELVQASPNELGAVVLVSDGADRSPSFDPRALSGLGVRVHTVAIGGESELRDTAIKRYRWIRSRSCGSRPRRSSPYNRATSARSRWS